MGHYNCQTVIELEKEEVKCLINAYHIIGRINQEMDIFDIIDCGATNIEKNEMNKAEFVLYMMRNLLINGNTEIKINLLD